MGKQPLLTTERLILRPLQLSDANKVQLLAGDKSIANGTINIPHPYDDGMAGQWIGKHLAGWQSQESAIYAITLKSDYQLIGCVHICSMARMVTETVERELGLPTTIITGRTLDKTALPPAEFEYRLTEFIDMVLAQKEQPR